MPVPIHDKTGRTINVGDRVHTPAHDHANGDAHRTIGCVEKICNPTTGLIEISHSSGLVREDIYAGCVAVVDL